MKWIPLVVALIVAVPILVLLGRRWRRTRDEHIVDLARRLFHQRREWLEAKFVTLASQGGRPRGLALADCEFEDEVAFARDRNSGKLRAALVSVTICFEAEEGGGMEHVEAVSIPRAATAVFHFDGRAWHTDGQPVYNLTPLETIKRYEHELETD